MARLVTAGAETRVAPTATASNIEGVNYIGADTNKPTIATDISHGLGLACWKMTLTLQRLQWSWTGANSVTYYRRDYIYFDAASLGAILTIGEWQTSAAATLMRVRLDTDMTVKATDSANNVLGTSGALSLGRWYLLETSIMTTSSAGADDAFEVRVDGTSIYSSVTKAIGTAAPSRWLIGPATLTGSITMRVDDSALNDSTGSAQTSYPGPGMVVHLQPASDNARTGWTAGAGATTSLFDALDNTPPVGVVVGSATNTSQIKDATNNATDTVDLNMQSYAAAGLSSGQVNVVELRAVIGNSSTTSRNGGIQCLSNPVIAELQGGSPAGTAAATFPTGWVVFASTGAALIAYNPSVSLAVAPVVRLRKATASTDNLQFCAAHLVVDCVPTAPGMLGSRGPVAGRQARVSQGRF